MGYDWCDETPDGKANCLEYEDLCDGEPDCTDGYDESYACECLVSKAFH